MEHHPSQKCWIEGEEVNCNPIDTNLASIEERYWTYRAISEVSECTYHFEMIKVMRQKNNISTVE